MTRRLTPWLPLPGDWSVCLEFKPADLWVGVYWHRTPYQSWRPLASNVLDVWVCLLPTLPIHLRKQLDFWKSTHAE